jgi:hypothetical protein
MQRLQVVIGLLGDHELHRRMSDPLGERLRVAPSARLGQSAPTCIVSQSCLEDHLI